MRRWLVLLLIVSVVGLQAIAQNTESADQWRNEFQLGIIKFTGNLETENYTARQTSTFVTGKNQFKFNGLLYNSRFRNREAANRWNVGVRYENKYSSKRSVWSGYLLESNKYAGYRQRHSLDAGFVFTLINNTEKTLLFEGGYRYVDENRVDNQENWGNYGRVFIENVYKFNLKNSVRLWLEYIPNLEIKDDYLINYEASLTSAVTEVFSLRIAYLINIDGTPVANKEPRDTSLTTSLLIIF